MTSPRYYPTSCSAPIGDPVSVGDEDGMIVGKDGDELLVRFEGNRNATRVYFEDVRRFDEAEPAAWRHQQRYG